MSAQDMRIKRMTIMRQLILLQITGGRDTLPLLRQGQEEETVTSDCSSNTQTLGSFFKKSMRWVNCLHFR